MTNKKDQHRQPVETLRLSGHGDTPSIPETPRGSTKRGEIPSNIQLSKEEYIAFTKGNHLL